MPHPDVHSLWVIHQGQKPQNMVEIVQRLADSHQNDVGYPLSAVLFGKYYLIQNLARGQVPHLSPQGGGAEHTAHIAPHLAGHTYSIPMLVAHQNRFHTISVPQPPQVLHRAVQPGHLPALHPGDGEQALRLQPLPQGAGQVAHLTEGLRPVVEPAEHLPGPEFGLAQLLEICLQLLQGHGFQLGHGVPPLLRSFAIKNPSVPWTWGQRVTRPG